jgi:hypothetical protein
MFDAKSILDALVRGGGQQQQSQQGDLGSISDMLKQLAGADRSAPAAPQREVASPGRAPASEDDNAPEERAPQRRAAGPREDEEAPGREAQGGGLDDLLRSVLGGKGGGLGDILGKLGHAGGSGGIGDILKQVLDQATSGVKKGAGRVDTPPAPHAWRGMLSGRRRAARPRTCWRNSRSWWPRTSWAPARRWAGSARWCSAPAPGAHSPATPPSSAAWP